MRGAARAHIVLRVDLEKPKFRTRVEDRLEMLGLEADSDASGAGRLKERWSATVMGFSKAWLRD